MSWFLRQLVWLIHRRKREEDLQEELRSTCRRKRRTGPPMGFRTRKRGVGAPRSGQRHSHSGRNAGSMGMSCSRTSLARSSLRIAWLAEEPGLHRHGRAVTRTWHRREDCDLQPD
jgi:hypothetical protein